MGRSGAWWAEEGQATEDDFIIFAIAEWLVIPSAVADFLREVGSDSNGAGTMIIHYLGDADALQAV